MCSKLNKMITWKVLHKCFLNTVFCWRYKTTENRYCILHFEEKWYYIAWIDITQVFLFWTCSFDASVHRKQTVLLTLAYTVTQFCICESRGSDGNSYLRSSLYQPKMVCLDFERSGTEFYKYGILYSLNHQGNSPEMM
jgi:hypothetical protein